MNRMIINPSMPSINLTDARQRAVDGLMRLRERDHHQNHESEDRMSNDQKRDDGGSRRIMGCPRREARQPCRRAERAQQVKR